MFPHRNTRESLGELEIAFPTSGSPKLPCSCLYNCMETRKVFSMCFLFLCALWSVKNCFYNSMETWKDSRHYTLNDNLNLFTVVTCIFCYTSNFNFFSIFSYTLLERAKDLTYWPLKWREVKLHANYFLKLCHRVVRYEKIPVSVYRKKYTGNTGILAL